MEGRKRRRRAGQGRAVHTYWVHVVFLGARGAWGFVESVLALGSRGRGLQAFDVVADRVVGVLDVVLSRRLVRLDVS